MVNRCCYIRSMHNVKRAYLIQMMSHLYGQGFMVLGNVIADDIQAVCGISTTGMM